jgi:hypothetical protein
MDTQVFCGGVHDYLCLSAEVSDSEILRAGEALRAAAVQSPASVQDQPLVMRAEA